MDGGDPGAPSPALVELDPRLSIADSPVVMIGKNPTGIQTTRFSSNGSASSQVIQATVPDSVVINSRMRLYGSLRFTYNFTVTGTGAQTVTAALSPGDAISCRAYPLHAGLTAGSLQLGNAETSWNQLWYPAIARLADDDDSRETRSCASRSDVFANAQDGWALPIDPYGNAVNTQFRCPGNAATTRIYFVNAAGGELVPGNAASVYYPTGGGAGGPSLQLGADGVLRAVAGSGFTGGQTIAVTIAVDSAEPLLFGGCTFGGVRNAVRAGIARVQRLALTLAYDANAARVLVTRAGANNPSTCNWNCTGISYATGGIAFANFALELEILTPALGVNLPITAYTPSYRVNASNPVQGIANLATNMQMVPTGASGATQMIVAQPIQLARIPSHIVIYVRPAGGVYSAVGNEGLWNFSIASLTLQIANQTCLAGWTQQQLYEETVRSGFFNLTWQEFCGQANVGTVGRRPTTGSFICLRPGISFPLPADACAGAFYQTTFSATATVYNTNSAMSATQSFPSTATPTTWTLAPEMVICTVDPTIVACERGLAKEIAPTLAPAEIAASVPNAVEAPHLLGGSFADHLGKAWGLVKKYGPGLVKPALEAAAPHLAKYGRKLGAHIADRTGLTKVVGKEAVERLRGNGMAGGVVSGGVVSGGGDCGPGGKRGRWSNY
jgi:hypothetical protein